MLNQISNPPKNLGNEGPIDMLLGCHQRIRHFTSLALKLANARSVPPAEISEAAASVHHYFVVSLPLHEQDENYSVHTRLRLLAPEDDQVASCSNAMVVQHQAIDDVVLRLLPLWAGIARRPDDLPLVSETLVELTERLKQLMDDHLKMEEEHVFPAMTRLLREQDMQTMLQEMQERRKV